MNEYHEKVTLFQLSHYSTFKKKITKFDKRISQLESSILIKKYFYEEDKVHEFSDGQYRSRNIIFLNSYDSDVNNDEINMNDIIFYTMAIKIENVLFT